MKIKKKNILITGALGQDGIILSKILIKKKYKVTGWIKKKKYKNKVKGVKYLNINLSQKKVINKNLSKANPSVVIHFGSENPSYLENKKMKDNFETRNIKHTKNLIESIIKFNHRIKFVFPSSSQIFSNHKKRKVNEKSLFHMKQGYTKFRLEIYNYLKYLNKKINFNLVNLILFNHDSIYRNRKFLIPRIIKSIKKKDIKFLNKIYKENIISDFSHAEDICHAIYLIIKKKIKINNLILSSGKTTKVNSIIKFLI